MLTAEALWLRQVLGGLAVRDLDPLLSIGSGDLDTRTRKQPWIDREIFEPLIARGVRVCHHEFHAAPGIDVAGDLLNLDLPATVAELGVQAMLCANVLEHLTDRRVVIDALQDALPPGGFLAVTVPRAFPYHPDPIDTMFRPTISELADEFAALDLIEGSVVRCESVLRYLLRAPDKVASLRNGFRSMTPAVRKEARIGFPAKMSPGDRLRQAVVATEVSCALFRKPS